MGGDEDPRAPRSISARTPAPWNQPPPGTSITSGASDGLRSTTIRVPWEAVIVPAPWAPTSSASISAPWPTAVRSTSYGAIASISSNPSKRTISICMAAWWGSNAFRGAAR